MTENYGLVPSVSEGVTRDPKVMITSNFDILTRQAHYHNPKQQSWVRLQFPGRSLMAGKRSDCELTL